MTRTVHARCLTEWSRHVGIFPWAGFWWRDLEAAWIFVEFLEMSKYEFHQIWQIWSKLAETEFWEIWKEEEWIKMVLGCGFKGQSRRIGLRSKLKCNRALALKISQAPNNFQNWIEGKNNWNKNPKLVWISWDREFRLITRCRGGFGGVLPHGQKCQVMVVPRYENPKFHGVSF